MFENVLAKWLMCVQVVSEQNRAQISVAWQIIAHPAVCGFVFAVLFGVAVLGGDEFRAQRNHAVVSIGDNGCAQYAVRVGDGAGVGTGFGTALTALNFAGVVELRAIERHKDASVEAQEWVKCLIFNQLLECHVESRVRKMGLNSVELFANVIVRGDAFHAEQGLAGVAVMCCVKAPLMVEERGALHEEGGEGGHGDIIERELAVKAVARIGQLLEDFAQIVDQFVDHEFHGRWL